MHGRRAIFLAVVMTIFAFVSPAHAAWRAVCREDVGRLCPPDQTPRATLQCLREHRSELSTLCSKRLPREKGPRQNACAADATRFCKDLAGRPAATQQCLNAHKAELAEACRARLAQASPRVVAPGLPCADDLERLCKDVPPDPGQRSNCLASHKSELSPPCLRFVESRPPARPCAAEVRRLCKGVAIEPTAVRKCLADHESELSPQCRRLLHAPAEPCREETQRWCKGVVPGEGRVIACLKQHEAELSAGCKAKVDSQPRLPKAE